jgi:hypothetical protein
VLLRTAGRYLWMHHACLKLFDDHRHIAASNPAARFDQAGKAGNSGLRHVPLRRGDAMSPSGARQPCIADGLPRLPWPASPRSLGAEPKEQ